MPLQTSKKQPTELHPNRGSKAKDRKFWNRSARIAPVGKRAKANATDDRGFAEIVKAKAHGYCQRCGEYGQHAHHALTKAAFPEYRHDPAAGCFLCPECHAYAHSHPAEFVRWWALESAEFAALLATARRIDKGGDARG